MKNRTLFSLITILVFVFTACEKKDISKETDTMMSELAMEGYIISVETVDYNKHITEALVRLNEDAPYSDGIIEYWENGKVSAKIEFGGVENGAYYTGADGNREVSLIKMGNKKGNKYNKVIIQPLIKPINCNYIVEGVIKFYSVKDNSWVATFDYGDGSCDSYITKTTAKGISVFSMDDYPEWN